MSLDTVKPAPGFFKHLPIEYRDLIEHGQYGKKKKVADMGKFKELIEEHPMCAGCAMTLGLELRFPDQKKDVIVMCGDGGLVDIGFQGLMHSWFRHEKFATIMLDNETYGNTGGQESGMTQQGQVMKMSPRGKIDEKMDMMGLAKVAKLDYIARVVPTNPARVVRTTRRAILIAREFGSTYVQAYTSCNIEYSIPTPDVMQDAFDMEKKNYGFEEHFSDRAKEYIDKLEAEDKAAVRAKAQAKKKSNE